MGRMGGMRRSPRKKIAVVCVALLSSAIVLGARQMSPLRIVSAGPTGVLTQRSDADQVRIVFSEPMVPIGVLPDRAPSWIHITPAAAGSVYWSGTKTLIFSPDASSPLPFATTF